MDYEAIALRIRGRKLWMPTWMWKLLLGTVTFSQVADSMEGDTVRIDASNGEITFEKAVREAVSLSAGSALQDTRHRAVGHDPAVVEHHDPAGPERRPRRPGS